MQLIFFVTPVGSLNSSSIPVSYTHLDVYKRQLTLVPPKVLSLEQAIDFIDTDELLEVTPESLRIRKKILDPTLRKRAGFKKN